MRWFFATPNPATIMTDTTIADKVYMEPLTLEYWQRLSVMNVRTPLFRGIGGQTGLNLAMQLEKKEFHKRVPCDSLRNQQ